MPRTRAELAVATATLSDLDPRLAHTIDLFGPCDLGRGRPSGTHFEELVRAICFQQLAGRAATTIHGRFVDQLEGDVTPARVLELEDDTFRVAGLSRNKQASILDLAAHVDDGWVRLDHIGRRTDEVIIDQLTAVRGIGRWTVEMFLMFRLGRLDVWPTGDLGVRRGFGRIFDLGADPAPKALAELGEPYRPYRSVVAWYCWRAADQVI